LPSESTFMNAISISVGVLIALLAILVFYKMRKLPQIAAYGSQRMCPSCGLITSRLKGMLLGVWPVSCHGECDPDSRQIEIGLSPRSPRL
jgi:hypothetical protein